MPTYDFNCESCSNNFSIKVSISEREKGLKCPNCGSSKLKQIFTGFLFFKSDQKSSCSSHSCSTCSSHSCK